MAEQHLVTQTDIPGFREEVNDLLAEGWRMVPQSLAVSTGSSTVGSEYPPPVLLAVVMERETDPLLNAQAGISAARHDVERLLESLRRTEAQSRG